MMTTSNREYGNGARKAAFHLGLKGVGILAVALCLGLPTLYAQTADVQPPPEPSRFDDLTEDEKAALVERWENLDPEVQETLKNRMKKRRRAWQNMSPEEQEAAKARWEERSEKWRGMTPEERQAARDKLRQRRQEEN